MEQCNQAKDRPCNNCARRYPPVVCTYESSRYVSPFSFSFSSEAEVDLKFRRRARQMLTYVKPAPKHRQDRGFPRRPRAWPWPRAGEERSSQPESGAVLRADIIAVHDLHRNSHDNRWVLQFLVRLLLFCTVHRTELPRLFGRGIKSWVHGSVVLERELHACQRGVLPVCSFYELYACDSGRIL